MPADHHLVRMIALGNSRPGSSLARKGDRQAARMLQTARHGTGRRRGTSVDIDWLHDAGPDNAIEFGLRTIFGPGAVVTGFLIFNLISGWVGFTRVTARTGSRIYIGARGAAASARQHRFTSVVARLLLTVLLFLLQSAWVGLAYFGGNAIDITVRSFSSSQFPTLATVYASMSWNQYAQAWVALSVVTILSSYFWSGGATSFLSFIASAPGYFYGFFGLVGGVLNAATYLLKIGNDVEPYMLVYMFTFGIAGAVYVYATQYATSASAWVREAWLGDSRTTARR
jgi:hypothetical protein